MKPYFVLVILLIYTISCNDRSADNEHPKAVIDVPQYDTLKYSKRVLIDTAGCSWLSEYRDILDTLYFDSAFVRADSDTFLINTKRKRLLTCNIPSFLMIPGDTILVTGKVYRLYAYDGGRFPAIITEIAYAPKQ